MASATLTIESNDVIVIFCIAPVKKYHLYNIICSAVVLCDPQLTSVCCVLFIYFLRYTCRIVNSDFS